MLPSIIKYRKEFELSWYDEHYKRANTILDEALRDRHIDARMQTNMAIVISTFLFFEQKLPWAFSKDELVQHMVRLILRQQEQRHSGSEVSTFWTCFVAAVRMKQLRENEHFKIDHEKNTIGFYWDEVHSVYMSMHREIFQDKGRGSSTMKGKLEHHKCWVGPKDSYRIGKRKTSAYLFDLDRTGTDLRGLLSEELVPTEAF